MAPEGGAQSKRPPLHHRHTTDSHVSESSSSHQLHQRSSRHQKHIVGGGTSGRLHARVPSSKTLSHKHNRRQPSPSPERRAQTSSHRRANSEIKLPRDLASAASSAASSIATKKNTSHTNLAAKRNRSHVEIGKRAKSSSNIKRSSSHKDVDKLKSSRGQVHFDLGDEDQQDDEWVDASASASPHLSRRGSTQQSPGKSSRPSTPLKTDTPLVVNSEDDNDEDDQEDLEIKTGRETVQHNAYLTSRLLQRTPSYSRPLMSTETASAGGISGSPESRNSRPPPGSQFGTPKQPQTLVGSSGQDELTSRFVTGSGATGDNSSFFTPAGTPARRSEFVRRPKSLGNLHQEHRHSITDDEDDSAFVRGPRRQVHKAAPAEKSRTQQKLDLQRASSSIEPSQGGGSAGVAGASALLGGSGYDDRDPRIVKLAERTGMEYLVVRRYQNPIARSIGRLSRLTSSNTNQRITRKAPGTNGVVHSKKPIESSSGGRYGSEPSKSRPTTPRRPTSMRNSDVHSNFDAEDEQPHERISGSSYLDGVDDGVAAILRNLWDKNLDLGGGQD